MSCDRCNLIGSAHRAAVPEKSAESPQTRAGDAIHPVLRKSRGWIIPPFLKLATYQTLTELADKHGSEQMYSHIDCLNFTLVMQAPPIIMGVVI